MAHKLPNVDVYVQLGDVMEKELEERKTNDSHGGSSQRKAPTIYKVPENVRQGDPDAYSPKLVSIGPIHHNKELEDVKWRYLRSLIDRSQGTVTSVKMYVKAIGELEQSARREYSVDIGMNETEFVKMLVLDGCFILEFLIKRAAGNVGPPWNEAKWNLTMLRNDMLLLENQIPFFVLEKLFKVSFPNGINLPEISKTNKSLLALALHYLTKTKVNEQNLEELLSKAKIKKEGQGSDQDNEDQHVADQPKYHHLLHLKYICELRNFDGENDVTPPSKGVLRRLRKCEIAGCELKDVLHGLRKGVTHSISFIFYFFVSWLLMCKIPRSRSSKKKENSKKPRSLPSAKKLMESGITFRKKEEGDCRLNVSFKEEDGILEIPFLAIQQTTTSWFRNLIAFEQCCPDVNYNRFTAYAIFMDKIIDTSEDVAILVKHGIIESKFGTDEDVAKLFNNICKGATLDYDHHYLVGLFEGVNRYCDSDRHRWRAALVHGYFHNPWVVISFLAAIVLLLLTLGGTVATIEQTVFTVKGYKKQFDQTPPPAQG